MKNAGVLAAIVILVFGGIIFSQSLTLDYYNRLGPGPGFFPLWLSGGLIFLTFVYFWEAIKKDVILIANILPERKAFINILSTVGSLVFFAATLDILGFVLSGTIMLFFMLSRDYKWYIALMISFITIFVLFYIFNVLLGVSLPVNMFGW